MCYLVYGIMEFSGLGKKDASDGRETGNQVGLALQLHSCTSVAKQVMCYFSVMLMICPVKNYGKYVVKILCWFPDGYD